MIMHQGPSTSTKEGGLKWWEKDSACAEYEADIDIPLTFQGGSVMVENTEDVYEIIKVSMRNAYKIKI